MQLEICVDSFQSAFNANEAGADRIELCSALSEGGLSPSLALLKKIKSALAIPVHVLVRPRAGNFTYSKADKEIMLNDIRLYNESGADGFVIGALKSNLSLDKDFIERALDRIGKRPITFHRAIDITGNHYEIIDQCIELGFNRILSSGKENKAIDAIEELEKMQDYANGRLSIMPASGINEKNIDLFMTKNFKDIHMSLRTHQGRIDKMGFSDLYYEADMNRIKQVLQKLKKNGLRN